MTRNCAERRIGVVGFVWCTFVVAIAQAPGASPCHAGCRMLPRDGSSTAISFTGFASLIRPSTRRSLSHRLEKFTSYPLAVRKAAQEGRLLRLQHQKFEDASIQVLAAKQGSRSLTLRQGGADRYRVAARTGEVGDYTFYYYGPGGGGVCYSDRYFSTCTGKLSISALTGPVSTTRRRRPKPRTSSTAFFLLSEPSSQS